MPVTKMNIKAFEKALKGTGGIYQAIADRMGVARQTVARYVLKSSRARMLLEQECESILDMGEGALFSKVKEKDLGAIKFLLSTKGKNRDYTEKKEVEHSGTVPVSIVIKEHKEDEEAS